MGFILFTYGRGWLGVKEQLASTKPALGFFRILETNLQFSVCLYNVAKRGSL